MTGKTVPGRHRFQTVENPLRGFLTVFAVCCAHNLFAAGEQIPHLQPEMYFLPGTRPGRKWIPFCLPLLRQILRSFVPYAENGAGKAPFCHSFFPLPAQMTAIRIPARTKGVAALTNSMTFSICISPPATRRSGRSWKRESARCLWPDWADCCQRPGFPRCSRRR